MALRCVKVIFVKCHGKEKAPMDDGTIIGLDLAKPVSRLHGAR